MKKWRLDFRIWHWVHAAVVLGLLGTVFLRKTFLSWRTNSELLSQKLAEMDLTVTVEQAKALATTIRAPMWEWHILLGYALAALLVWRILLFFTDSGKRNYQNLKEETLHKKVVKLGYIVIYGILVFMAVSGLILHFHEALGLTEEGAHTLKELHELVYNAVLIFVPLHIIGVVIVENREEKGIISEMVHGGEK
ncbi:cytochrome b/b6 domain-containing protein [Sulfurovum sp.]|jgi:cytochrome b561|uniref:cytochrome b/b6 domain-containing protein n=1 Tax=Sulfurovum sp. TaxID=1969726 RepID=UPI002A364034|nr:cytochrome b/b6 domain-containing protein [Sulfurovum sp.]MDD2451262.1 cytochrome b/b6 domain-containing protein [Sulfurovum sp.]MDD3499759.1 cytochrome b/b6 domain-containing protein [Sulfurovum sp.]MDY0403996.1 cytochrome b/b6 domain-containing protein [Sulfurovum sp.]